MKGRDVIRYEFAEDDNIDDEKGEVTFLCEKHNYSRVLKPFPASKHIEDGMKNYAKNNKITNRDKRVFSLLDSNDLYEKGWIVRIPYSIAYHQGKNKFSIESGLARSDLERVNGELVHKAHTGWSVDLPDGTGLLVVNPVGYSENGVRIIPQYIDQNKLPYELTMKMYINQNKVDCLHSDLIHNGTPICQIIPIRNEWLDASARIQTFKSQDE